MNGWSEDITNAITYIEENSTEDIDIKKSLKNHMYQASTFKKYLVCYAGLQLVSI